ncbi:PREDICTED: uncharacterized protein LOC108746007 isoform X2 [Trachymyrmex septentrionalis]|uniref:uncharacterized protein LOC108746007 isoform X2 n=1 Tax=Trachymyrmex septentrionalis TaxID=34720 RepID=UPI00084EF7F5|nr:PREDICTED: uncharacterized protein LOC108746007 isoform X2 [Trachymyrmex septentrionalis]XP_018337971.1 PREDICTED: uncharacterized protein LOC108746007 isoform X2 [Trachymyrmex septentrionalis]XP_018337973.1 PREDICTED: uncharacterized protein LOC108746007 isoform X2 [Trachymyrmex septentrionalis]
MSANASCERSRASTEKEIVTPTILPKKASEAKVVTDTVYVSKIQHCSQKDVTSSGNKPSRKEVLDAKRARLRQLFKSDAIDLDNSFRELGYAFIPTQP